MNYTNIDIDYYRMSSISKGILLCNDIGSFLEIELSNTKFEKIKILMNKEK